MSERLSLVGSAAFVRGSRIYGLMLLSSADPEATHTFGGTSAAPKWMVYALVSGNGRVLVGLFDQHDAALRLFERIAEARKFMIMGRVAVCAQDVLLIQAVPSARSERKVQIEISVVAVMKRYTVLIPGPLEFEAAATQISRMTAMINGTEKVLGEPLHTTVYDADPSSSLVAAATADQTS